MAPSSPELPDHWQPRKVLVAGEERHYRVYNPFPDSKGKPIILFLHGAGESGTDNICQADHGLARSINEDPSRWPFIVIAPQKPVRERLWPTEVEALRLIVAESEREFQPDPNRWYLTGLSQGGHGSFNVHHLLGHEFAAVAPICGWGEPRLVAKTFGSTPVWIFHGLEDDVVPASCSVAIHDCLIQEKADVKITLFEGVGHDSWTPAYKMALPEWFLSHNLGSKPELETPAR